MSKTAYPSLREANRARQIEWDSGNQITLAYRGNELAGEAGEVCNVIKKLERERLGIAGSRDTVQHLAEELADTVICADLIAMSAGIDLDAAVEAKFNATSEKVGLSARYRRARPAPAYDPATLEEAARGLNVKHLAETVFRNVSEDGWSSEMAEAFIEELPLHLGRAYAAAIRALADQAPAEKEDSHD